MSDIRHDSEQVSPVYSIGDPKGPRHFPIVGIGASAGGIEALNQFFRGVPKKSGMAYVVVQHLHPTQESILPGLLQCATPLRIVQAEDRMLVEPDCIYVMPPNKDMCIRNGVLYLFYSSNAQGPRLPVDFFLRSLSDDSREHSVAVILSGTGTDGTLGIRAVKEQGGAVFVQEPDSAEFDGMPSSAINTGLVDGHALPEELPMRIISYLRNRSVLATSEEEIANSGALDKVIILIHAHTGHDFSQYKPSSICRRLERRMGIHQIMSIDAYITYLRDNPQEIDLLFKELLIGVTKFFRDEDVWKALGSRVIPEILGNMDKRHVLRGWVPGCSTGEEAYSLAILFSEALAKDPSLGSVSVQIFATDIDQAAIEQARRGFYPANIEADVSPDRLEHYFTKLEDGYQVTKSIREMVIFAQHNLVMDPPFTKLDILSCRNLLIYMTQDLQKKIMPVFHYSLRRRKFLILGSAESIGSSTDLFEPFEGNVPIYLRIGEKSRLSLPISYAPMAHNPQIAELVRAETSLTRQVEQMIVRRYSPASVLTNTNGDIVFISGKTGMCLEPAAGKANLNIFAMAREGLRHKLRSAFFDALERDKPVSIDDVPIKTNGVRLAVSVLVEPLKKPDALSGMMMIVFREVRLLEDRDTGEKRDDTLPNSADRTALEEELRYAKYEVSAVSDEREMFTSANEELQSTNEALQIVNEELTTSKEEMQSINEELQTVNQELKAKVEALSRTNNDIKNLLESTEIATVFLDAKMRVRLFTKQLSTVSRLKPRDIGRPITDIASSLFYPDLESDVQEVLESLSSLEREVVSSSDGKHYRVRIMPYKTVDNMIDGVVVTFSDITMRKELKGK